jgi:hypothetical protein
LQGDANRSSAFVAPGRIGLYVGDHRWILTPGSKTGHHFELAGFYILIFIFELPTPGIGVALNGNILLVIADAAIVGDRNVGNTITR